MNTLLDGFTAEFGPIADRFELLTLTLAEAADKTRADLARPGVYIFTTDDGVVKAGRHLDSHITCKFAWSMYGTARRGRTFARVWKVLLRAENASLTGHRSGTV
jgi:hypothetical protein